MTWAYVCLVRQDIGRKAEGGPAGMECVGCCQTGTKKAGPAPGFAPWFAAHTSWLLTGFLVNGRPTCCMYTRHGCGDSAACPRPIRASRLWHVHAGRAWEGSLQVLASQHAAQQRAGGMNPVGGALETSAGSCCKQCTTTSSGPVNDSARRDLHCTADRLAPLWLCSSQDTASAAVVKPHTC
jgi:hypothetical protein